MTTYQITFILCSLAFLVIIVGGVYIYFLNKPDFQPKPMEKYKPTYPTGTTPNTSSRLNRGEHTDYSNSSNNHLLTAAMFASTVNDSSSHSSNSSSSSSSDSSSSCSSSSSSCSSSSCSSSSSSCSSSSY